MPAMLDPLLSAAFALEALPGGYAVLLGSGVSRAAGIPTGWEITLDLIQQIAAATHQEPAPALDASETWFATTYTEAPTYDRLLSLVGATEAERMQKLRRYFEPGSDDSPPTGQGGNGESLRERMPTTAHQALARLVRDGFVRVIITTNFDRLMELALQQQGIEPTVIATPEAAEGALPLAHTRCVVVKVHGDYLSTKLKNTPEELSQYDDHMNRLLDQIFDEYGLVVCGWSAVYDTALRSAITRCPTHRFSTFWAARGEIDPLAEGLLTVRRAIRLPIASADAFFQTLEEQIAAIHSVQTPHPLTAAAAGAVIKRYLVDERERIRLDELVAQETERVFAQLLAVLEQSPTTVAGAPSPWEWRLARCESLCGPLLAMTVAGGAYSAPDQYAPWVRSVTRLATPPQSQQTRRFAGLAALSSYPALLALYAGGIAALTRGNDHFLAAVLLEAQVREQDGLHPVGSRLHVANVATEGLLEALPLGVYLDVRLNERLERVLRPYFTILTPDGQTYRDLVDRFEYLLALVGSDLEARHGQKARAGHGLYETRGAPPVWESLDREVNQQRQAWAPLAAGLFGNDLARFRAAAASRATLEQEIRQRFAPYR